MKIDKVIVSEIEVNVKEVCEYDITVELVDEPIEVIIQTLGAQGPPGTGSIKVIDTTDEDKQITNQDYLILTGAIALLISLEDSSILTAKPVEILNAGTETSIIRAKAGQTIFYNGLSDQEFEIPPGSVYKFVPKGTVNYAS